jgi:CDP-glucose 4,6-dehydratase
LRLAERLLEREGQLFARAWNLGPNPCGDTTVGTVATTLSRMWGPDAAVELAPSSADPPEAGLLRLDNSLARSLLGWKPRWSVEQALERTLAWYRAWMAASDMAAITLEQLKEYAPEVRP